MTQISISLRLSRIPKFNLPALSRRVEMQGQPLCSQRNAMHKSNFGEVGFPQLNTLILKTISLNDPIQLRNPGLEATNWRAEQAIGPMVVTRKVWGGWMIHGIFSAESGLPANITAGFNNSRNGDRQQPGPDLP